MTHCGRQWAHIRLLQPLLSCRLLFKSCCQVQEEQSARAYGSARTHTDTNTQHFFSFRMRLDVHKCVKCRRQLTLKADRSISSRLRAGESLAMMEGTKRRSQLPRYPQTAFAVTTVWSSLPLGFSLSCTVMSQRWTEFTVASLRSAAGRVSDRERTARA